jgi:hypothetical protein
MPAVRAPLKDSVDADPSPLPAEARLTARRHHAGITANRNGKNRAEMACKEWYASIVSTEIIDICYGQD